MAAGENVLAVALAAGIPLPHSCRQGRCASCRAKLLSGEIAYPESTAPDGALPPGLSAAEAAAGAVLLCQARPRTDLVVETRLTGVAHARSARAEIVAVQPLPFEALRLRLRLAGSLTARPGQFVDAAHESGVRGRLPVIAVSAGEIDLEAANDGGDLREWLGAGAAGSWLTLTGPFDAPR